MGDAAIEPGNADVARSGAGAVPSQSPSSIDLVQAAAVFKEADEVFRNDDGKLWGMNLVGPMMFVDAETRAIVANMADAEGKLTQAGSLYVGELPPELPVANTAMDFGGVHWSMVMWPLPEDSFDRRALLAHESWHRIQEQLGLPSTGPDNSHLDELAGRIWLQMEWCALAAALAAHRDVDRRRGVGDAIVFRAYRRSLFDGAAKSERDMEMHEGLAEYTGFRLAAQRSDPAHDLAWLRAAKVLGERPGKLPTFVRSFAYVSGPAYGLLLDEYLPEWRTKAKTGDFGQMLAQAIQFELPSDLHAAALSRASAYKGDARVASENDREAKRMELQKQFHEKYVDGAIVEIPLRKMQMSFDPNDITPYGEHGTVYGVIDVSDVWGKLTASQGCLVGKNWDRVVVAAAADTKPGATDGPGWTLTLNPGWKVVSNPNRTGSFVLKQEDD